MIEKQHIPQEDLNLINLLKESDLKGEISDADLKILNSLLIKYNL